MSKKELIRFCTIPVLSSERKELQKFVERLKGKNKKDILAILKRFLFTEGVIFLFFSVITGNPSIELLISLIPVGTMVLIAYTAVLIGIICHNAKISSAITKALADSECIRRCADQYTFVREQRNRVGNDVTSASIWLAVFQQASGHSNNHFYVGLRSNGLFFDTLSSGCQYQIYAVNEKYICFVRC